MDNDRPDPANANREQLVELIRQRLHLVGSRGLSIDPAVSSAVESALADAAAASTRL